MKIKRICETCGKEFLVFPCRVKHDAAKFCSRECYWASSLNAGEKNPNWTGGKIPIVCKICGNIFYAYQWEIKNEGKKYCSRKCAGIARSRLIGKAAFSWKGGKVKCTCLICGTIFYVFPYTKRNGHGKYCSLSCAVKAQRHSARTQKTHPELIFEGICQRNELPFCFVGDGRLWLGNANPDFVHNSRKLCVEIYGDYWHSPLLNGNMSYNHTLEGRRKQLKAEGYKLIVIWESDLKRKDAEPFVLYTLKKHKIYPSITGEE